MSEIPIGEEAFKLACTLYLDHGGTDRPALDRSTTSQGYAKLRNTNGDDLAVYCYEYNSASDTLSLAEPEWPEPVYSLGPRHHIHTLGAISANYSMLEGTLIHLFPVYTKLSHQTCSNLFKKLSNELRITTIRDALEESNHPAEIEDSVEYFLRAFMTIFNARIILMYAVPLSQPIDLDLIDPLQIPIMLEKRSTKSPTQFQLYEPSLGSLRRIADSAPIFGTYGSYLSAHIMCHYEKNQVEELLAAVHESARPFVLDFVQEHKRTLPDKPPQPTPLIPRSPEDLKE